VNALVKAIWKGAVIAESDATVMVEGNHYFPPESVKMEYLSPTETTSVCPWKGRCHYYTITVGGERNIDAAWVYANPKPAAGEIAGYFAFWNGVEIVE
jgi:uncharacterized protein (DUF427 family)